jgi:hypothetical protein
MHSASRVTGTSSSGGGGGRVGDSARPVMVIYLTVPNITRSVLNVLRFEGASCLQSKGFP